MDKSTKARRLSNTSMEGGDLTSPKGGLSYPVRKSYGELMKSANTTADKVVIQTKSKNLSMTGTINDPNDKSRNTSRFGVDGTMPVPNSVSAQDFGAPSKSFQLTQQCNFADPTRNHNAATVCQDKGGAGIKTFQRTVMPNGQVINQTLQ